MTYKELLEDLQKLNEEALSKDAIVWDLDDLAFRDIDFSFRGQCETEGAADKLNDQDYYYFVV